MIKLLRNTAAVVSALSIAGAGIAGVAGASSVTTQGPDSPIRIHAHNYQAWDNDNHVRLTTTNHQESSTGNAKVKGNTTGGSAASGSAANSSAMTASVSVKNTSTVGGSSSGTGSLSTAGPDSAIHVRSSNYTRVNNDNDIHVYSGSTQNASSGNASVSHNTTGGSATSGNASNTNTASTTISVTN